MRGEDGVTWVRVSLTAPRCNVSFEGEEIGRVQGEPTLVRFGARDVEALQVSAGDWVEEYTWTDGGWDYERGGSGE